MNRSLTVCLCVLMLCASAACLVTAFHSEARGQERREMVAGVSLAPLDTGGFAIFVITADGDMFLRRSMGGTSMKGQLVLGHTPSEELGNFFAKP